MPRVILPSLLAFVNRHVIDDNTTESITVYRGGVAQTAQNVLFGRPIQQNINEGEAISPGTVQLPVYGDTTLDLQPDDTFTRSADGKLYTVIQPSAMATNGVSRTAIVEMRI